MANKSTDIWTRLKTDLAANKRKSALLGGLVIVALVVWGRQLLPSSGPKTTAAAVVPTVATVAAGMAPTPSVATPAAARSSEPLPRVVVPQALASNPFKADWYRYERVPDPRPRNAKSRLSPLWQACVTAMKAQAAAKARAERERLARIEAIRREAAALKLQGTMLGAEPVAQIDGEIVRIGQEHHGFRVEQIEPKRVLVHKQTQRFWLVMR